MANGKFMQTVTIEAKHSDTVKDLCMQRKFSEFINKCLEKLSKNK